MATELLLAILFVEMSLVVRRWSRMYAHAGLCLRCERPRSDVHPLFGFRQVPPRPFIFRHHRAHDVRHSIGYLMCVIGIAHLVWGCDCGHSLPVQRPHALQPLLRAGCARSLLVAPVGGGLLHVISTLADEIEVGKERGDIMMPKLCDLCEYSRFYDYLDAWPQQTAQMNATRVLYTEMEKGMN